MFNLSEVLIGVDVYACVYRDEYLYVHVSVCVYHEGTCDGSCSEQVAHKWVKDSTGVQRWHC